ncbi:MAG: outer membrane beta-barrel protein [Tannerellaceae bacterium]|nr:outer membrane beta-barrel protein [Tannerellaceae bacterium]
MKRIIILCLCVLCTWSAQAQRKKIDRGIEQHTFIPKGLWLVGGSFSYTEMSANDFKFLVLHDINAKAYTFSVGSSACYFFRDNVGVGGRFSYARDFADIGDLNINLNEDLTFSINDASLIQHMYYGTGFIRTYMSIGNSKIFGLFSEARVTFGAGQGKTSSGSAETLDQIYQNIKRLQVGFSPGLVAFVTDNAAVEASVGVMGFDSRWINQDHNKVEQGTFRSTSAKFKIDLFSINLGMSYYF